jgi:hypothetical protein
MNREDEFEFTIIALIYRSPVMLLFFYFYLNLYTPEIRKRKVEFFFVANNPNFRTKATLRALRLRHYLFNSPILTEELMLERNIANPEYLSRVYAAYNFGVHRAKSKKVILVNSDMIFSKNWLTELSKHGENFIVSANLVERNHPKFSTFPGAIQKNFGSKFATFRRRKWNFFVEASKIEQFRITRTGGSYMPVLFDKSAFESEGGYFEGNLGNGENLDVVLSYGDEDLFRRLNLRGLEHITSLNSFCYHFKEGERETSPKVFFENRIGIKIRRYREQKGKNIA